MFEKSNVPYFIQLVYEGKYENKFSLHTVSYKDYPECFEDDYYEDDNYEDDDDRVIGGGAIVPVSDKVLLSLHKDFIPNSNSWLSITNKPCVGIKNLRRLYNLQLERVYFKKLTEVNHFTKDDFDSILKDAIEDIHLMDKWTPVSNKRYEKGLITYPELNRFMLEDMVFEPRAK